MLVRPQAWRARYDFQVVPHARRPVLAVASHKLGACAVPAKTIRDRDAAAFLAEQGALLVYPRDAAPYVAGAAAGLLAENDWNGRVDPKAWTAYERRVRETPTFGAYLNARQAALANYSTGRTMSAREACGDGVTAEWAACFRDVRTPDGAAWSGGHVYRPPNGRR